MYNGSINCADPAATRASIANAANWTFSNLPLSIVLPVEWRSFEGFVKGENIELQWTVASETNNEGFQVQKSKDGRNWENIGFVGGAGNTHIDQAYSWLDTSPSSGANYYRLVQIDFDYQYSYSELVVVNYTPDLVPVITISPNPVKNNFRLTVNTTIFDASISIYSPEGKLVKKVLVDEVGNDIDISTLPTGLYYVELKTENYLVVERLVRE